MTLTERVQELVKEHGGLRKAAYAINIEPGYLCKLGKGEVRSPSELTLRRMGLVRIVNYIKPFGRLP
jgi:hypothetical protein